jgi:hypothetical protein
MTIRVIHEDWVDHHNFDFQVAAAGRTIYWILTSTWLDHVDVDGVTIDLNPGDLNEKVAGAMTSDRHEAVLSGVAERT